MVIYQYGLKVIDVNDQCLELKNSIFKKTGFYLTEIALLSIYQHSHAKCPPSFYTLDVLSNYIGFTNWENFCQSMMKYAGYTLKVFCLF